MSNNADVRSRRAYFDCRFGQLHVRTAFPGTGGFDEFTTLFCIHPQGQASRVFDGFLKIIAQDRSVYAPDRPGCGESDGSEEADVALRDAQAMVDLAKDLRLRKIDVLGFEDGCAVAVRLAILAPDLVRRVAFVSAAAVEHSSRVTQSSQLMQFPVDVFATQSAKVATAAGLFLNQK